MDLLSLMNCPDLMDGMNMTEIEDIFKRSGFDRQSASSVTMNWGPAIGKPELKTSALIVDRSNALWEISQGSQLSYDTWRLVENIDAPSRTEIAYMKLYNDKAHLSSIYALSKRARDVLDRYSRNTSEMSKEELHRTLYPATDIATENIGFIRKLLRVFIR